MFSERASFVQWLGPKRFQPTPLKVNDLPPIEAILISHDHYNHLHLDKLTIIHLSDKAKSFFVPLGIANILEKWGIQKSLSFIGGMRMLSPILKL